MPDGLPRGVLSCLPLLLLQMAQLLSKMQLAAVASADGSSVTVHVPITRSDVLHGAWGLAAGSAALGREARVRLLALLPWGVRPVCGCWRCCPGA